ncbi:MAG: xanthine dehydrogenase family protein subunit M [Anaerolineae bacterium]|nr:xanthine dehydrogenase family protein subunit M [Anaerolineae bacterium]
MAMNPFAYARAATVEDALEAIGDGCRPLAGGTDLLALIAEGLIAPERLVDLKRIPGLEGVREGADGVHVGALARLSALIDDPLLAERAGFACLREALSVTASPQLRHMATLGGNLLQRPRCWYYRNPLTHCLRKGGSTCYAFRGESKYHAILGGGPCHIVHPSDPAVALLALDASVVVAGQGGVRRVPLDAFYLLPRQDAHREVALGEDELLTEVVIPLPAAGARGTYVKVAERQAWDFALVSAAVQLTFEGEGVRAARIALGGVAPVPWRAHGAEAALTGAPLTGDAIARAAEAATEGARPLAQNAYKVDLAQGVVRQALQQISAGGA